jgi:hypothetical protein
MDKARSLLVSLLVFASACGGSSAAHSDGGGTTIQTGPTSLAFAGDPEGLWWDAASSKLYIADQESNTIVTWTDAGGFVTLSTLPGGAQGAEGLGQLVLMTDGNVLVVNFGYGTNGAIYLVTPDGTAVAVSGLDPTFRRLGLTQAADGTLYEGYFVKNASGSGQVGSVAKLTLTQAGSAWSGTETPVVTGLGKPAGVLAQGDDLYITDQATSDFIVVPVASLPTSAAPVVASNLDVDLLSAGPSGTFFTGSSMGDLNQLTAAGTETSFASGYMNPRGSAYDATNHRVFFGNHIQSVGQNQLVIVPAP